MDLALIAFDENFSVFTLALKDLIFDYIKCQWTHNLVDFWAIVSLEPKKKAVSYVMTLVDRVRVATDYILQEF